MTTNYTLDLAAGLTQVLDDGTITHLYGNGRIAQVGTPIRRRVIALLACWSSFWI